MRSVIIVLVQITMCFSMVYCENINDLDEARGKKKKKYALFIYVAHLVLKKIFILKLFYAFVFWVILHKAGYLFGWFVTYLKDKKKEYIEHHDHDHDHDHSIYDHGHDHGPPHYYHDYGSPYDHGYKGGYGPYKRKGGK